MVMELTASRLIAKHVGSSLYTWTSVIGVVLAGITIGNFLGGRLADRYKPRDLLPLLFMIASVLCFAVLWVDQLATAQQRPESWSWAAWVLALVSEIFLLPSLALGTISPVVAALALSYRQKTGATVGNLYAWGALGSILGTFLTGFVLIDQFGTRAIMSITAVILALMAVGIARGWRTFRTAVVLGWLQFLFMMSLCATATETGMARVWIRPMEVCTRQSAGELILEQNFETHQALLNWWGQQFETRFDKPTWEKYLGWRADSDPDPVATRQLVSRMSTQLGLDAQSETLAWIGRQSASQSTMLSAADLGWQLGRHLHQVGFILGLRSDVVDEYHDESHYSHIAVFSDTDYGNDVRALQLDKLVHSYYDPDEPSRLYYEYEQIYAAITERVVADWSRDTVLDLSVYPKALDVMIRLRDSGALPAWLQLDSGKQTCAVLGALTPDRRSQLLHLVPAGSYWEVLEQLQQETCASDWGGFTALDLPQLPPGTTIPTEWSRLIQHDPRLEKLTSYQVVSLDILRQLVDAAPDADYYHAVTALRDRSRRVSSLFLGGGGYVFPRWIENRFPDKPRIDVAELDPAVKRAVHAKLGLVHDSRTAISTRLGDARNVVDDLLRSQLSDKSEPAYDFVYGDAFNDFSIPWHLTTLEFTRKVRRLLKPDGVYLINVIDILPRTVFPPHRLGLGETTYRGSLPDAMQQQMLFNRWNSVVDCQELEFKPTGPDEYRVRYGRVMASRTLRMLQERFADRPHLQSVIEALFEQTRTRQTLTGTLPGELAVAGETVNEWVPSAVCESLEMMHVVSGDRDGFVLGFRGAMTKEIHTRLRVLAPENTEYLRAIDSMYSRSRAQLPGRFLARYVQTVADVFDCVYVFSSTKGVPHDDRDTFVIVCSDRPVNHAGLLAVSEHWDDRPFASLEHNTETGRLTREGQMDTLLELGQGVRLTDNYAPVENLLAPIITRQDE